MKSYVLDSYAVLAYFLDEEGAAQVEGLLREAAAGKASLNLSAVNLGEVAYITQRKAGAVGRRKLLSALDALPVTVVDADRDLALAAAEIKAKHAVSYADCFALALARRGGATVVTGDPEFKKVQGVVPIHWLPEKPKQR
ncbi:PilT-like protein [Thermacetogenium phaeum DSM 12270]|uniref:Ribonuclease VapC n=1 Tax=Thermacetogenium phaeum (strain ATCC BAA-254 / DSM 26808 / PB) TaxID=1089553 RepID=K4LEY5_THEPS|nr:type II toxin-antitoxin system VapC family toxin [Thermacetogenium phaeum]AFV10545.1 PilT-like protein [Thermacetogenium phaeum DSM 12270]